MAEEGTIEYKIVVDDSDIARGADRVEGGFSRIGQSAQRAGTQMDGALASLATQIKESENTLKDLSDEMLANKQKLAEYQDQLHELNAAFAETAKQNSRSAAEKEYGDRIKQTKDEIYQLQSNIKGLNFERENERATLSELKERYKELRGESVGALQAVVEKYNEYKAQMSDTTAVTERIRDQGEAMKSVSDTISTLSQQSTDYSAKAQQLRTDIEETAAAMRNKMSDGEITKGSAEHVRIVEVLKQKIAEFGEATTNASATATAALNLQVQNISALEEEIAKLTEMQQQAAVAGNTDAVNAIQGQISTLTTQLEAARGKLGAMQQQATQTEQALNGVAEEMKNLSKNADTNSSFFGQFADGLKAINADARAAFDRLGQFVSEKAETIFKPLKDWAEKTGTAISTHLGQLSDKIGLDRLGNGLSSVGTKIGELGSKIGEFATGHGKFQQSLGDMKTALNGLPMPLGGVITSIRVMTKALWNMCKTPIGAVLAAVALGLQAVHTWFAKSAEGQRTMTKISAYLGSILSSMTDIVVTLGKWLYHAFADANGPMNAFGKGMVTTFKAAVKTVADLFGGLGTTIKGVFKMDWSTIKDGLSQIGKGLTEGVQTAFSAIETSIKGTIGMFNTVKAAFTDEKLGASLSRQFGEMEKKANNAVIYAERELTAQKQLNEAKEKAAKLDIEIAEKRDKIYELTGKEKLAMIEEVKLLQKKKFDDQIKAQRELTSLVAERNGQHTRTLENIKEERDARIQLYQLEAQQAASTRMMTRMESMTKRSIERKDANDEKREASEANKANNKANAITAAEGKINEVYMTNAAARAKLIQDLERQITDARIAAMKDGGEKARLERENQLDKDIEQIKANRTAAVLAEIERQRKEFESEQAAIKAHGGTIKAFDTDKDVDQSAVERISKEYDELIKLKQEQYANSMMKAEADAMLNYLKQYGTYQEQKLAIAKEYAEKIAQAQNEGERKTLEKQRDKDVASVDGKRLALDIDWSQTFSGIGNVLQDMATETLKKIREYMSTDEFKALSPEKKQAYQNYANQLQKGGAGETTSPFNFGIWSEVAKDVETYQDAVKKCYIAEQENVEANEQLTRANEELQNAVTAEQKEVAKRKVEIAKMAVQRSDKAVEQAEADKDAANQNLQVSTTKAANGVKVFSAALSEMKNGSLFGFADGMTKLITSITGASKGLQGLGKVGGIVGAILQIIDAIGDNAQKFFEDLLNKLQNTIESVLANLPQLIASIVRGIVGVIGGIFQGLGATLGLTHSNETEVNRRTEKLTKSNEAINSSINALKESIDKYNGGKAVEQYQKAVDAQKLATQNSKEILDANMGKHGSHHSNAYYWNLSNDMVKRVNDMLGTSLTNSWQSFSTLTEEQMNEIRTNAADIWQAIITQGKYDNSKYFEDYANQAGKIEELTNKINENIMQTSFESMRDNFVNTLMDMQSSAKDFSKSLNEKLTKSLLNATIGNKMDAKMKKWYDDWANIARKQNGNLTKEQIDEYRKQWEAMVQEGVQERNRIASLTGYDKSSYEQSSTSASLSNMTQDTGDEIAGRLTGIQNAVYEINEQHKADEANRAAMLLGVSDIRVAVNSMLELQTQGLDHLALIEQHTASLPTMAKDLDRIRKKTDNL